MCLSLLVRSARVFHDTCFSSFPSITFADPFEVFERGHPDLIAFNSNGNSIHHIDFMAREKKEMRQLTQATQICDNVWVRVPSV